MQPQPPLRLHQRVRRHHHVYEPGACIARDPTLTDRTYIKELTEHLQHDEAPLQDAHMRVMGNTALQSNKCVWVLTLTAI